MREKIIKAYINRLTKNDIVAFAKKNGVTLSNNELELIYTYLKNDYEDMINNPSYYLAKAKKELSPNVYNKLVELYSIYYPKLYH